MSSQPGAGQPIIPQPPSPPPPPPSSSSSTLASGGVRRHHTISTSSRSARTGSRDAISEEAGSSPSEEQLWNDDEVVDQDWVGGVGAVGEKSLLHRQSSLPTRYHRAFHQGQSAKHSGTLTPKTMNSLSAIAGHEGDEEDWEREMRGLRNDEEHPAPAPEHVQHQQVIDAHSQQSNPSPLSPHFGGPTSHVPSPPPAGSAGVRRHQSLTYGAAAGAGGGVKHQLSSSALKRSGTLQVTGARRQAQQHTPSPPNEHEDYEYEEETLPYDDDTYYPRSPPAQQQQQQVQGHPASQIGRQSPWNNNGNDWRGSSVGTGFNNAGNNAAVDDVQRALSALEIASNNYQSNNNQNNNNNFQGGQSAHPPRFNPNHPPPTHAPGMRTPSGRSNSNNGGGNGGGSSRNLQLVTDFDGRKTPLGQGSHPASASAYVPPIGSQQLRQHDDRSGTWEQKAGMSTRTSNPNLNFGYQQGKAGGGSGIPSVPTIPTQYLNQQQQQQSVGGGGPRLGVTTSLQGQGGQGVAVQQSQQGFINTPIDVPSLIAAKGYNPTNFDVRPSFARFFVIKSYTEDDVHKSLKYEIWSSTDPGNKRLDKAFKECAGRGPIYLFFSVNASGHFCGMAEMLTPVDYTRSSTVWASDKWKGVFKVRWIFVRDIPNANLRHIRLNNTQERKPVTNSRDTQELLPDAGQEMLKIFHTHPARTSLLQDFAFYELQAMQKLQGGQGPSSPTHSSSSSIQSPQPQQLSPANQSQQNPFVMSNPYAAPLQMQQMTPMMQMQMQMNMGMNSQFAMPQAQAMHQSVMRHPSPPGGSLPVNGQNFMGMGNF